MNAKRAEESLKSVLHSAGNVFLKVKNILCASLPFSAYAGLTLYSSKYFHIKTQYSSFFFAFTCFTSSILMITIFTHSFKHRCWIVFEVLLHGVVSLQWGPNMFYTLAAHIVALLAMQTKQSHEPVPGFTFACQFLFQNNRFRISKISYVSGRMICTRHLPILYVR